MVRAKIVGDLFLNDRFTAFADERTLHLRQGSCVDTVAHAVLNDEVQGF
jgi:hypothetical protein